MLLSNVLLLSVKLETAKATLRYEQIINTVEERLLISRINRIAFMKKKNSVLAASVTSLLI